MASSNYVAVHIAGRDWCNSANVSISKINGQLTVFTILNLLDELFEMFWIISAFVISLILTESVI